jgi:hypothetical protein
MYNYNTASGKAIACMMFLMICNIQINASLLVYHSELHVFIWNDNMREKREANANAT